VFWATCDVVSASAETGDAAARGRRLDRPRPCAIAQSGPMITPPEVVEQIAALALRHPHYGC
jgi:hypothetical protein